MTKVRGSGEAPIAAETTPLPTTNTAPAAQVNEKPQLRIYDPSNAGEAESLIAANQPAAANHGHRATGSQAVALRAGQMIPIIDTTGERRMVPVPADALSGQGVGRIELRTAASTRQWNVDPSNPHALRHLSEAIGAGLQAFQKFTFQDLVFRRETVDDSTRVEEEPGSKKKAIATLRDAEIGRVFTAAAIDKDGTQVMIKEREAAGDSGFGRALRSIGWNLSNPLTALVWKGLGIGDPENLYPDVIKNFLSHLDTQGYFTDPSTGKSTYDSKNFDISTTFFWRNVTIGLSAEALASREPAKDKAAVA